MTKLFLVDYLPATVLKIMALSNFRADVLYCEIYKNWLKMTCFSVQNSIFVKKGQRNKMDFFVQNLVKSNFPIKFWVYPVAEVREYKTWSSPLPTPLKKKKR